MQIKFAIPCALVVFLSPATMILAQDRVATRPVVNIFSLPAKPSNAQDSTPTVDQTAAPKSETATPAETESTPTESTPSAPVDPFAELPLQESSNQELPKKSPQPPTDSTLIDPFDEPLPEPHVEPFRPNSSLQESAFQKASEETNLQLSDMPLNVDPFTQDTQDSPALEALPAPVAPRQVTQAHNMPLSNSAFPTLSPGVSWAHLQAPPIDKNSESNYQQLPKRGLKTATIRRPAAPTPTISIGQPAIVHVPVQIKVIPTYFDFPYYPYYPAYYQPRQLPKPAYDSSEYYGNPKTRSAGEYDYSYLSPTDQKLYRHQDPNLVGFDSRAVNYVGYPLNYFSRPVSNHYGVHVQSFPTSRRFDR